MSIGRNPNLYNSERKDKFIFEKDDPKIAGMYDLGKTIGIGHFAVVKLARHVFTNEKVAVKVIDKQRLDELSRDHLFQEVVCMKLVKHPNIVRLYHIIDTTTKLYLILELGDGGDLYDYITKHVNGINEKSAKVYFRQIVNAIAYCHKLHVVHRDLKPENVVFFEKEGMLKLTDFGFSNQFIPGNKLDTSCGSLAYSAPEILLGKPYDAPKVDIWSLGVILFMLVVGRLPFQEKTDSETLTKIMDCSYETPESMSEDCKKLIGRLLVKDPSSRASLDEILSNPWLTSESQLYHDLYSEPLISKNELSYEDHVEILNRMNEGGIASIEEIQSNLDHDEYNHITATYYLLAERKLKRQCDDITRLQMLLQTNENDSDEPITISRNNSITPGTAGVSDINSRRFSMIVEDEEYQEDECPDNKKIFRFSYYNHDPISSNIIEEENDEFNMNEEAEEMETVISLVQFRSDLPLSYKGPKATSFLYEKNDLRLSQRNSKSLPPSSLANLISTQFQSQKNPVNRDHSVFYQLRRMVKTKSCPFLEVYAKREDRKGYERNPKIEATKSIDDAYIPTLRNPRIKSRPGSMLNYPCSYSQRNERKRRSSVASPIGVDASTNHVSLSDILRARNHPNCALPFSLINMNVQRFIEKRRSVPHNLYKSNFPSFLTSNARMSSRYSKISTKSLSSSETPSDSENNYDYSSQKLIKSFTDRRRGSSETVQFKCTSSFQRKQKTHSASFQNQNFLFNYHRSDNASSNSNFQEWYNSAPSLLNIDSFDKFKNIKQQQQTQPNTGLTSTMINVGPNQVTGGLREFCEPIREEEDETTKSISALNSSFDPLNKSDQIPRLEILKKTVSQGRFTNGEIRNFSSYYPTLYSARESVVNQLPMNWSAFSSEDKHHDAETRSVSGYYYTRKYNFPKVGSRLTGGALSPQLTPNISLSSLASSLRQSRHMLDVIRGTFELQQQSLNKKRFNTKNDSENENYSPENSMIAISNDTFNEHKIVGKAKKNSEFYSSFSDEEFLAKGPRKRKEYCIATSKPSSDNSYNVSLLNESLDENPCLLNRFNSSSKTDSQRKRSKVFSKSDNRLSQRILNSRTYFFKVRGQSWSCSKKSITIKTRKNYFCGSTPKNKKKPVQTERNENSPSPKQVVKGFRFFCCHR